MSKNTQNTIKYTMFNNIVVGHLPDVIKYIQEQGHTTTYLKDIAKDKNTLNITQVVSGVESTFTYTPEILPEIVNDRFLHTNASTGALEWIAGSEIGNYVTLDTAQTISGAKTFSTTPIMNAISRKFNNITWTLNLPAASGTIGLASDIDTKVSQDGDTMSGGLSFNFNDASNILYTSNDSRLQLCGGDRDDRASVINLYGGSNTSNAGGIDIIANDGTTTSTYKVTKTANATRYVGGLSTDVDLNTLLPMEKEAGLDNTNTQRARIFQNQFSLTAGSTKTLNVGRTGMIFFKRGSNAYCGFWSTWDTGLTELVNTLGSGTFTVTFNSSTNVLTLTNNTTTGTASMDGMVITTI